VVEARQGDGTYRRQSESTLLPEAIEWGLLLGDHTTVDLIEARAYLEVAHAELAAERRTDADLSRMETHLQEMEDAGDDVAAFNDADVAFHLAVAAASGNTVLYGTLASIRSLLRAWINRVIRASAGTRPSYEEHVPVYEAIRAGDASAAAEAMRAHMNAARQRLMATVDPTNDGVPIGPKE
jgi:DNA-binding FadR family transcriptional regulator